MKPEATDEINAPRGIPRPKITAAADLPRWEREKEEPAYMRDNAGLTCLMSQLGRINAQMQYLECFKKRVADAEVECKRDLAASLEKSQAGSSVKGARSSRANFPGGPDDASHSDCWVKCWDAEVGADYYYNNATGEASWLVPGCWLGKPSAGGKDPD